MIPFRKKQQGSAELRLQKANTTTFLTNETIQGTAVFKLPSGVDFDHSKIILKGTVRITTEEASNGSLSKDWRTEKQDFLAVSFDSKAQTGFKTADSGIVKVPFRFDLKQCVKLSKSLSELPPSLDSKEEGHRSSDNQYSISYSIAASAFSARGPIATTTQKICIVSVSQDVPTNPSDFPREYFWAETIPKLMGLHPKRSSPRIEVAGQEPEPLVVTAADNIVSGGATEIPFVIKLLPPSSATFDPEMLPTQCSVKTRLVKKTQLTPDGKNQTAWSSEKLLYRGKSEESIQKSPEQEHTMNIGRWDWYNSSPTEPFALAKFSLPFTLDGEKTPQPTFSTSLLSRRYAIDVTVSFADTSLKLSLPLEILFEAEDPYEGDYLKRVVSVTEARL